MRCLTLADALRQSGAQCTFICRPHSGHLLDMIVQRGHLAVALPTLSATIRHFVADPAHLAWLGTDWQTDAQDTLRALEIQPVDWLVVDHYALDRRWEQALRPHCQRLMVIDDLADRPHDCDVLLDQNLGRTANDYSGLLNSYTTTCIGPQFALLRPEFAQLRSQSLARRVNPQLKRLLVTMGGVDKDNATGQVLQALSACNLPSDLSITVVMGPHAPFLATVQQQAAQMQCPTQVLVGVSNMAQLMVDSDLAIGAAGSTSWERCCLGLPTFMLILAENQSGIATALEMAGAAVAIDMKQIRVKTGLLAQCFESIKLNLISKNASSITDGLGVQRILETILNKVKDAH